jgi:CheY-like chemotaxis protein
MSNMQDGFLGKVSKGIKKRIFDDEPEVVSDSSLIGRLQSLANTESAILSKKTAEPSPPVTAGTPAVELAIEPAPSLEQHQETSFFADGSSASDVPDPIQNSRSLATILVVEDEIVTQRLTRKILEDRGYEVIVAADGVDALMALGKMNFDLIVCDINMPNMDGFKLLEFLNQKDILIPVIFVTIREDVEDEIKGLALGAKDYIRKPINRDLLLLRIRKALDK